MSFQSKEYGVSVKVASGEQDFLMHQLAVDNEFKDLKDLKAV